MRVCVIAPYNTHLDEGSRNIAVHFSRVISRSHEVLVINYPHDFCSGKFWITIKKFKPDIIHFYLSFTIRTLILSKILSLFNRNAKVIFSGFQPPFNQKLLKILGKLIRPDIVLTQFEETSRIFNSLGFKVQLLPNGVDLEKFKPVTSDNKIKFRHKYSIDENKYVVLHVGPISKERNLRALLVLRKMADNQTIIVGSSAYQPERQLFSELQSNDCLLWTKYADNIEELYQLSDVYVFPTVYGSRGCIDMPLSVMEAMACNLPVVSTPFGGLPAVFKEGEGLYYINNEDALVKIIEQIKITGVNIQTREKVINFSWDLVASELERIYSSLLT
jgi:glycosyltransferase involved in cell wall biosynthesis